MNLSLHLFFALCFSSPFHLDPLRTVACHWNLIVYAAFAASEVLVHVITCDTLCHSMSVSITFSHLELPQILLPHIIRDLIHIHEVFRHRLNKTKSRPPFRSVHLFEGLFHTFRDVLSGNRNHVFQLRSQLAHQRSDLLGFSFAVLCAFTQAT